MVNNKKTNNDGDDATILLMQLFCSQKKLKEDAKVDRVVV